jgi:hypothetical protein
MTQTQITLLIFIPLIVWRLYSRYRKLVGKQPVHPRKLWASAIIFPLLFILFAFVSKGNETTLLCLAGGGIAGIALSFIGHKLTKFDNTDGVLSYTPNAYLGLALTSIFVMRIAYRYFQISEMTQQQDPAAAQQMGSSPLTMLVFGLLVCYYASYSIGILMWRRKQLSAIPV